MSTLTHEQAKRFYDGFGAKQDWQRFYERSAVEALVAELALDDAHALLEFGCGTGSLARELLATHLPADARYTAIDASTTMVGLASERLAEFGERVEVVQSDGTMQLPAADQSVDRCLCVYVLDLLSEPDIHALLAEAHRVLRPGGLLGLTSLGHGRTIAARVIESMWVAVHRLNAMWVGGCRPLALDTFVSSPNWRLRHHQAVTQYALSSEILVAERV